jgi:hypothetical protein
MIDTDSTPQKLEVPPFFHLFPHFPDVDKLNGNVGNQIIII